MTEMEGASDATGKSKGHAASPLRHFTVDGIGAGL